MKNEDYFEYIKKKSFEDKLRALCDAVESMTRQSYKASERGIGDENRSWYSSESKAQGERADFLFRLLIEEHKENSSFKEE